MDDRTSPHQDRDHIEIIELGSLDKVFDEFPVEESLLLRGSNASGPSEPYRLEDEFPSESSPIGGTASEEPARNRRSELARAPLRTGAIPPRRPALAGLAALAAMAIAGAFGLELFNRSRSQDERPSATLTSDVVLISESTNRQSSAPVERRAPTPETQTSSILRSPDTRAERVPTPPARPSRIVEQSGPAAGAGLVDPRTTASSEVLASRTNSPPVIAPLRTAPDVPAASPVGTASAPTDAAERPSVERPVDVNIAPAGRALPAPVVTPTSAIQRALAQYQSAFSQLDVMAVRQVWPTVDGKALTKAFDQLRQEQLTFDSCDVRVNGGTAVASCVGTTQYVPRVGNKSPRVERQQWRISLRQATDAWVIDTVDVSRN